MGNTRKMYTVEAQVAVTIGAGKGGGKKEANEMAKEQGT